MHEYGSSKEVSGATCIQYALCELQLKCDNPLNEFDTKISISHLSFSELNSVESTESIKFVKDYFSNFQFQNN